MGIGWKENRKDRHNNGGEEYPLRELRTLIWPLELDVIFGCEGHEASYFV